MRTILVATDFSIRSDRALRRAVLLARQIGARLILVHVVDEDRPARLVELEGREAEGLLAETAATLVDSDGLECRSLLRYGDAFSGVLEAADEIVPDLLLLGAPRRQLLEGMITGTTTERVIRAGRWPVLVANGVPARPYRRIVLATDLSPGARAAAEQLRLLGLDRAGSLAAVHVYAATVSALSLRTPFAASEFESERARERREASSALARWLAEAGLVHARRLALPDDGGVADRLLTTANQLRAELLVLASRGRIGLGKLLLGSTAEAVLRRAEIDVLVVPPEAVGTSVPSGAIAS